MKLTYEEYMNLVPEQTKKMVEATLPYLWIYVKRNKRIKLRNTESYDTDERMQQAISILLGSAQDQEVKSFFEGNGFSPSRINIAQEELPKLSVSEKKEIFEQSIELFMPYEDITKYSTIQPIDLINKAITLGEGEYYFNGMLRYIGFESDIKTQISTMLKDSQRKQELQLERKIFEQLPISAINYLETASKIRTAIINLYKSNSLQEQELLKNDDSYIVPISLLLALYEYEGQEKAEIVEYFKSKSITLDNIRKNFTGFPTINIRYTDRNLECVKELYKRYWTTGVNKDVKEDEIQVVDILSNVLDRNFTGVVIIDKVFERLGTSTDEFDNLKKNIEAAIIRRKMEEEMNYTKSFYKELRRDTKDFINLTTRIYQVILKKMQEGKHNKEILICEDDADTLALYIASHFYNTDFEVFYADHGVTFEKVMKLLGISITREEIEQEELNQKLVVDKFKRFVLTGVNSNKRPENISINDVAYNLCNRDFNKSMIMENIFEEIRRDIDLPANFMCTLEDYLKNKEEERKRKLSEEYFADKSNEVYEFLEKTSRAYITLQFLVKKQNFQDEELVALSLLYALFDSKTESRELYAHMGLSKDKLDTYLNINFNRYAASDPDIDIIVNKIAPYIEQTRDNESQKNLTVKEITENIFTSKRQKSLQLSRLLAQYDLSYESFDDFTETRKKIEEEKCEQAEVAKANALMTGCNNHAIDIIKQATKIFQVLEESTDETMVKLTSNDMVDISILLGILRKDDLDSYKNFRKYNITEQEIINLLELPRNLEVQAAKKSYSPKCFLTHFTEFGDTNFYGHLNHNDLLNILLRKNSNVIKSSLEALGVEYEVFTRECLTGKDFESTLTIDDRCSRLDRVVTPEVNTTSTTSILTYGSELANHTTFINEHCTGFVLKNQNQEASETIRDVLDKVYEKKKVQKRARTWFEKLVGTEVETTEEIKVNGLAIAELKSVVSQYIEPLYDDIRTLDSLAKYLETYRKKVVEHRNKADEMWQHLSEDSKAIDEDDFEKILRMQTYLKAVKSKKDNFELTDHLVKQYIYKTYIVMQNDLVTITGLEMSRDVLIPLLEAETLLGNSIQNQVNGATITENVVKLLGEVVSKNTVGIQQGLDAIKESGISEEKLSILSQDIAKYLTQINEANNPNDIHLETLPQITPQLESSNTPIQKKYVSDNGANK